MRGDYRFQTFRIEPLRLLGWKGILVLAVAGALAVALMLAATGLFLILLPVFLVAGLVARFFAGRNTNRSRPQAERRRENVIDTHYEVVDVETHVGRGWGRRRD